MRKKSISALILLASAGCVDSSDSANTATTDQEVSANNGSSLNGSSLNGSSLNGSSLNGSSLNGVSLNGSSLNGSSLNGSSLNGSSLNGSSLNGSSLNGSSLNGSSLNGTDFIGATLVATTTNGVTINLHIDDIAPLAAPNDDLLAYAVSYQADDGWHPLCGYEDDGSVRRALAVNGVWNNTTGAWSNDGTQFTFACRKASIAKCVELGYKYVANAAHLLSCVRMLRADYCGDGVSHTVTGTLINLYDSYGNQTDTENWPIDAEWTPDGSICFNHYRGSSDMPLCPEKYQPATCGTFSNGAYIIDEYQ